MTKHADGLQSRASLTAADQPNSFSFDTDASETDGIQPQTPSEWAKSRHIRDERREKAGLAAP
jgi:hypothetical protein